MPVQIGKKPPAFKLPSSEGGELGLADLAGKYAVIYFYPKDATPGCTLEAQDFRDAADELAARNAVVIGVSKDSISSHCKFRDKHGLGFPLLSDASGEMIEEYGAWGEKTLYGKKSMGILRSTVVLGPEGKVVAHFPKVRVKGHVEAVLAAIDADRGK
jgi:peroxiredoxin Q/BCP